MGFSNRTLLRWRSTPAWTAVTIHALDCCWEISSARHAVPGVESATLTTAVPLTFIVNNSNFVPEEKPRIEAATDRTDIYSIGPRFFETMGMSFQAGDDFHATRQLPEELRSSTNPSRLRTFHQSAIGRRIVGDGKRCGLWMSRQPVAHDRRAPRPTVYLPILSEYPLRPGHRECHARLKPGARTRHTPDRCATQSERRSIARGFDVRTIEEPLGDALLVPRLAGVLSMVACIGLAIATIGVYGVISFAVARRRRELGIRLAIGARPRGF